MKKWRCTVCGYIYVRETPPAECPVCGAGPEFFEELAAETISNQHSSREEIQQVLFKVPCGLFMVASRNDSKYNGMINNSVFQITDQPLQLLLGIDKRHLTTEYIIASKVFTVNFLSPSQLELVKHFGFKSGREVDKFIAIPWKPGITGAPILSESPGFLECRVQSQRTLDAGTHLVFLAEVLTASIKPDAAILSYQEYRERKKELWR